MFSGVGKPKSNHENPLVVIHPFGSLFSLIESQQSPDMYLYFIGVHGLRNEHWSKPYLEDPHNLRLHKVNSGKPLSNRVHGLTWVRGRIDVSPQALFSKRFHTIYRAWNVHKPSTKNQNGNSLPVLAARKHVCYVIKTWRWGDKFH